MTYRQSRQKAAQLLKEAGIENEIAESGFLLEAACQVDLNHFLVHQMEEMPQNQQESYFALTKQRCERIPLQHLTGRQEFMGLVFRVNEHVLIPRQDTELLVEEALKELRNDTSEKNSVTGIAYDDADVCTGVPKKVLDLCTGSGCIAISLKSFCPDIIVSAGDISREAIAVASENALQNHVEVDFIESDLFSGITGEYDMIVSNPPYIPSDVIPTLMPEVRDHEPHLALDGSTDGLAFYKRIIEESANYLKPGGMLLFEIGCDQGEAVAELLEKNGFEDIMIMPDLAGLDRVIKGRRRK